MTINFFKSRWPALENMFLAISGTSPIGVPKMGPIGPQQKSFKNRVPASKIGYVREYASGWGPGFPETH